MSKTIELAQHLEKLHINNMYKSDFYWTWDKTDEELDAIFTVADALRDLREEIGRVKGKGIRERARELIMRM